MLQGVMDQGVKALAEISHVHDDRQIGLLQVVQIRFRRVGMLKGNTSAVTPKGVEGRTLKQIRHEIAERHPSALQPQAIKQAVHDIGAR